MSLKDLKTKLSPKERDECHKIFKWFDKKGTGSFGIKELQEVMQYYGMDPSGNELKELIDEMDSSGNELVNFEMFMELFLKKLKDSEAEEELREAFKVFDKDGNGFLATEDLRIAMTDWGEGLTSEEFEELLREMDIEDNQQIDFEELITLLFSSHKSSK